MRIFPLFSYKDIFLPEKEYLNIFTNNFPKKHFFLFHIIYVTYKESSGTNPYLYNNTTHAYTKQNFPCTWNLYGYAVNRSIFSRLLTNFSSIAVYYNVLCMFFLFSLITYKLTSSMFENKTH